MPDPQGHASPCPTRIATPKLWPATCWPTSPDPSPLLSNDFPCSPSPFSSGSYAAGFILNFSLLAPADPGSSLANFLLFFFYPEDGGDAFLRNVD
jgi:hypothetical protein